MQKNLMNLMVTKKLISNNRHITQSNYGLLNNSKDITLWSNSEEEIEVEFLTKGKTMGNLACYGRACSCFYMLETSCHGILILLYTCKRAN